MSRPAGSAAKPSAASTTTAATSRSRRAECALRSLLKTAGERGENDRFSWSFERLARQFVLHQRLQITVEVHHCMRNRRSARHTHIRHHPRMRVIQYPRDVSDTVEKPRRTGYPACARYDGLAAMVLRPQNSSIR